ncbi:Rad52/Rad22 family DNA repair protein, partial [Acinetobacter baumannii]
ELIESNVDDRFVKSRSGGGSQSFPYLQETYLVLKLNQIFGEDNWSFELPKDEILRHGPQRVKQFNYTLKAFEEVAGH